MEVRDEAKKRKTQKNKSDQTHTGARLGSHSPIGNETLCMDFLGKVSHGDENDVCFLLTTHFATTATCTSDVTCAIPFPVCVTGMTFCLNFQRFLVCLAQGHIVVCTLSLFFQCAPSGDWTSLDFPCNHTSY